VKRSESCVGGKQKKAHDPYVSLSVLLIGPRIGGADRDGVRYNLCTFLGADWDRVRYNLCTFLVSTVLPDRHKKESFFVLVA
jgi:hypothetical protein